MTIQEVAILRRLRRIMGMVYRPSIESLGYRRAVESLLERGLVESSQERDYIGYRTVIQITDKGRVAYDEL